MTEQTKEIVIYDKELAEQAAESFRKLLEKKGELKELATKYTKLEIKGVDDLEGFLAVDKARKDLKQQCSDFNKDGLAARAYYNKTSKDIKSVADDLIGELKPTQKLLEEMQAEFNEEREKNQIPFPGGKQEIASRVILI